MNCGACTLVTLTAGASVEKLGEAAACAVKRINLDMRMAYAARKAGAELREEFEVTAADFDQQQGLWTVSSGDVRLLLPAHDTADVSHVVQGKPCADVSHAVQGEKVKARLLVIADGATSRLATKLGYCTEPPRGVCSRAFVEGGTHNTDFDGATYPSSSCCLSRPVLLSSTWTICNPSARSLHSHHVWPIMAQHWV